MARASLATCLALFACALFGVLGSDFCSSRQKVRPVLAAGSSAVSISQLCTSRIVITPHPCAGHLSVQVLGTSKTRLGAFPRTFITQEIFSWDLEGVVDAIKAKPRRARAGT
jgi:hypothetical protein